MQDLTMYSDDELSLQVFNDEGLYLIRDDVFYLLEVLEKNFTFTDEQKDVLLQDINDDLSEANEA